MENLRYFHYEAEQSNDVEAGTVNMGRRCIVAGCSNTTRNGVSLYKFPREVQMRKQWTLQVRRIRADWKEPSAYSVVDCFECMAEKIGLKMK